MEDISRKGKKSDTPGALPATMDARTLALRESLMTAVAGRSFGSNALKWLI